MDVLYGLYTTWEIITCTGLPFNWKEDRHPIVYSLRETQRNIYTTQAAEEIQHTMQRKGKEKGPPLLTSLHFTSTTSPAPPATLPPPSRSLN
jgi:hypothetical protein